MALCPKIERNVPCMIRRMRFTMSQICELLLAMACSQGCHASFVRLFGGKVFVFFLRCLEE